MNNDIRYYILELTEGRRSEHLDTIDKSGFEPDFYRKLLVKKRRKTITAGETKELKIQEKRKKDYWGSHEEIFKIFGNPKVSRGLSTATDIGEAINAIVSIGNILKTAFNFILRSKSEIDDWFTKRRLKKNIDNISKKAIILASSIVNDDNSLKKRVLKEFRTDSDQGHHPIRIIMASEIALAFHAHGVEREKLTKAYKDIFGGRAGHKDINEILSKSSSPADLLNIVEINKGMLSRNIRDYLRSKDLFN